MIAYFVSTDAAKAEAEARAHGWVQVAVNRWMTADRDDLRLITSVRQFTLIPGGSYLMPAQDLREAAADDGRPWGFKQLVESGVAQWVTNPALGEDGTWGLVDAIMPPAEPVAAEQVMMDKNARRASRHTRLREVALPLDSEPPEAA